MRALPPKIARLIGAMLALHAPSMVAAQEASSEGHASKAQKADQNGETVEAITARKLFLEGRALLEQNQPRAACEPLERSQKLVPALGTLLNLGLCHSYSGHLATAHDYYRQAEVLATLQRDTRRREFAHNEAAALAPRRATLTLRISGDPNTALEVRLDDVPQAREVWEHPMFIDAGEHRIRVQGVGEQSWEGTVLVADGNKHVLVIPAFAPPAVSAQRESARVVEPAARVETVAPPSPKTSSAPQEQASRLTASRIGALSVAGAGVIALGASLVFTLSASSTYDDSEPLCRSNDVCSDAGVELREQAMADATIATVLSITGAAAVVGGVTWWFLAAPSSAQEHTQPLTFALAPGVVAAQWKGSL